MLSLFSLLFSFLNQIWICTNSNSKWSKNFYLKVQVNRTKLLKKYRISYTKEYDTNSYFMLESLLMIRPTICITDVNGSIIKADLLMLRFERVHFSIWICSTSTVIKSTNLLGNTSSFVLYGWSGAVQVPLSTHENH